MKYCTRCGKGNEDSINFCIYCGEIFEVSNPSEKVSEPNIPNPNINNDESLTVVKRNNIGCFSIVFIISIIVFVFIHYWEDIDLQSFKIGNILSTTSNSESVKLVSFDFIPSFNNYELIPVECHYYNTKNKPLVEISLLNNTANNIFIKLEAEIPKYTSKTYKQVELGANEKRSVNLELNFNCNFYKIHEMTNSQLNIIIKANNEELIAQSKSVKLVSKGTMSWSNPDLIASFVTPNDPLVEEIISKAKELNNNRNFSGYLNFSDIAEQQNSTKSQIRSIFFALRQSGISYVNSSITFASGHTQRIRTPAESILQQSANCIDGAVLFASLFENIGLEPLVILGPEHAFVGVRIYPGSRECFFIETTITGESDEQSIWDYIFLDVNPSESVFEKSCQLGTQQFTQWIANKSVNVIDIKKCRQKGYLPAFPCN